MKQVQTKHSASHSRTMHTLPDNILELNETGELGSAIHNEMPLTYHNTSEVNRVKAAGHKKVNSRSANTTKARRYVKKRDL